MEQNPKKQRLDEILINEGLITEAEVKEALLRQKAHGGKFGSQLLYHRYIDETGLIKALTQQFGCEGVVLSKMEIPEIIVGMIPKKIALARKVLPFDYDINNNTLKVACENPTDQSLINEINFIARGKNVKLYLAAEIVLNTAITKYYLNKDISLEDNLLLEIPEEATDTGKTDIQKGIKREEKAETKPTILLITDENYAIPLLKSLLERDDFRVIVAETIDEAHRQIEEKTFHTILIRESISEDYLTFTDWVRKLVPNANIRFYDTASSLLLKDDMGVAKSELLLKNLDLFTSLLSSKLNLPTNHSGRVGRYVDKLCRNLGLSDKDRLFITNAAYIHDLARFYYSAKETEDNRVVITLTIKLLSSLNYPSVVLEILRSMYIELNGRYINHLPIEILGGNILTIVDLFCDTVFLDDRLSLDTFDAVKKKLRDQAGKLFLAEVVEAFIGMIQGEILNLQTTQDAFQIMIYADDPTLQQPLSMRLKNEGFRIVSHSTPDGLTELYKRSEPDLIIIAIPGQADNVSKFINKLIENEINFDKTPAFLLTDSTSISGLTRLLEKGLEDIISLDDNLDFLVTKIRKLQSKLKSKNNSKADSTKGARGRLADMNLIDLLQALGPSRKTARIMIKSNEKDSAPLVLYLDLGNITYAKLNELTGAEAVYAALAWSEGTWTVEPITTEEFPESNNDLSNDSILIEGCRLLDEKVRAGQLL